MKILIRMRRPHAVASRGDISFGIWYRDVLSWKKQYGNSWCHARIRGARKCVQRCVCYRYNNARTCMDGDIQQDERKREEGEHHCFLASVGRVSQPPTSHRPAWYRSCSRCSESITQRRMVLNRLKSMGLRIQPSIPVLASSMRCLSNNDADTAKIGIRPLRACDAR